MYPMLEYKGYHASIDFDAEDEILVGEVFGISDSLNFHGTSIAEIKDMFHQSIDNYLELCEKIGKNPEKEYKGTFNVRISPELHKKAALRAAEEKITLNQFVTEAIRESLENKQIIEREKVIYVPVETEKIDWDSGWNMGTIKNYNEVPIYLMSEENVVYGRN